MVAPGPPWLVSGFRFRARLGFSIPATFSGPRGITAAFGYSAPHSSAGGTSTLLSNALLSAHYAAVRLLHCVHVRIAARRLRGPIYPFDRRSGGLPVLVHAVSRRARVFDHAASRPGSRFNASDGCCLPAKQTVSARGSSVIGAQSPGPPMPLSTLRLTPSGALRKTRGQNGVAAPFL